MPALTVYQNGRTRRIPFEGTPLLADLLREQGLPFHQPCGGRGVCGKCAVELTGQFQSAAPDGKPLACQTHLLGDCELFLGDVPADMQIQTEGVAAMPAHPCVSAEKYGIAVDIGTTTVALRLYGLNGEPLSEAAELNPQLQIAADVIGRIGAALEGKAAWLQSAMEESLSRLLQRACGQAGIACGLVRRAVITGNTTMLYLLTGESTDSLSHAPFRAEEKFGTLRPVLGMEAYLPPCMDAFVGADITCAVLASGICRRRESALLVDIGTNGEVALWHEGKLFVSSTAAGPAFEGVGISCGCGSVAGAIDRVWMEEGKLSLHTIGEKAPVGLCGSGLIDAVAALLESGWIDETGAAESPSYPLAEGVSISAKDIRNVQLAKGAIAAGVRTLLCIAGVRADQLAQLCIAGGFGSHLNIDSAAAIGLIPKELTGKVAVLGNAALAGAALLLADTAQREEAERIAAAACSVHLGGNATFSDYFMDCMMF